MAMDNITLTSGMRQNLFSLQRTAKAMDLTQNRLSSGKKVNSALDDPIAFFAAQGHTQRSNDLAIRKDEMSEAIQTIKAADNGINAVLDLISSAKSLAQSALANQDATERAALTEQYNSLISQIATVAADSNYKGTNLLGGTGQELNITFDESGDSTLTVPVLMEMRWSSITSRCGSPEWVQPLPLPMGQTLSMPASPFWTMLGINCVSTPPPCPTSSPPSPFARILPIR
jgi:hypothetical protein